MTLNEILSSFGGIALKVILAIAAIVFIVVFFDNVKRVFRAIGSFFASIYESIHDFIIEKKGDNRERQVLPWIICAIIGILIIVYAVNLFVTVAGYNETVDYANCVFDNATDETYPTVLTHQTLLEGRALLFGGKAALLAFVALVAIVLLFKKCKHPIGKLHMGLAGAFSLYTIIDGCVKYLHLTRMALDSGVGLGEYKTMLSEKLAVHGISAASNLLCMQVGLQRLRFVLLAVGIMALTGFGAHAIKLMRKRDKVKATTGFKGKFTRPLLVTFCVVMLYVSVVVLLNGALNILSVSKHTSGLTDALNEYGCRDAVEMEAGLVEAQEDIDKANGKIEEAQTELDEAQTALDEAEAALATDPENEELLDAKKSAEKDIKSAEKKIKKQNGKIEDAEKQIEEINVQIDEVRANAVKYPARTKKDLFSLAEIWITYVDDPAYTTIDERIVACSAENAEAFSLTVEEFTYMVTAMSNFNLSASDIKMMHNRFIYLAVGIVLLAALIVFTKKKYILGLTVKHAFLSLVALLSVFPFYWIVVSSTNTSMDISLGRLLIGNNLLTNLANATFDGKLMLAFTNSMKYSLVITVSSLLVSSAAGYGFVVYKSKGKERVMKILMLSMMIPQAATLIPLFKLFSSNNLNLLNTVWAVTLPSLATAFLILMFRQGAQSFPKDLIEAARIDGMGEFGVFAKLFLPVMRPTYAAAATVTFMNSWNAYLWPLISLSDVNTKTMPIYVSNLMDGYVLDFGMIMLGVTISTIPTVIIFFLLQKNFVNGILGSVKQ